MCSSLSPICSSPSPPTLYNILLPNCAIATGIGQVSVVALSVAAVAGDEDGDGLVKVQLWQLCVKTVCVSMSTKISQRFIISQRC